MAEPLSAVQSDAVLMHDSFGEVPLPSNLHTSARLYVGSLTAAQDLAFHDAAGITHVLTVAGRLQVNLPRCGPAHLSIDLCDHPTADLLAVLDECLAFCDLALGLRSDAQGIGAVSTDHRSALLVHCASGVSRSVAVCVALLMTRGGFSLDEALASVRTNRLQANPNLGFMTQLQMLERFSGDTVAAKGQWTKEFGDQVFQEARRQREAANDLHAKLDDLENMLAAERSMTTAGDERFADRRAWFVRQLDSLQDNIDGLMADSRDRVARTILKAAAQKASRLLEDLSS
eukprot:gnl/TRDRNA2_/TRDRNA2_61070_c0_seq1.p1 gnl/TRDRNA2_/TRDRNA2_61070_c0~~gnl/TRDRNA2_/TRDRNA2_61070_c0_seq1.p1  ORF type:complete len:288 (+),score=39.85 gnl/TRDRNA2_/TRDRNA2_61070_c0_seq1:76-939(+)